MIQDIIDGIISALRDEFSSVEKIYTEQVKQGLVVPCFILQLANPLNEPLIGKRYHRKNLFVVQYISESETGANAERYSIIEGLFKALEYITVNGDLVRGIEMHSEYLDDILTFFVSYNIVTTKVETEPNPMELIEIENEAD